MKSFIFFGTLSLWAAGACAQAVVNPADVVGKYFTSANGFETRVVHPKWDGDRLVVEDIRFRGNYPLIAGNLPPDAVGAFVYHPASMVGGILTYEAPALFGKSQPQTVVFRRTEGPATGGVHATITFEGPPESSPSTFEAVTRSEAEWAPGDRQPSIKGDPGRMPG